MTCRWEGVRVTDKSSVRSHDQYINMHYYTSLTSAIDLSNLSNSKFIHPIGQNGDPFSKFYDNYLDLWQRVEYIDMKTVDYNSLYVMTYTP